MAIYNFLFYFVSIALLLSYVNYRFVGLHPTIAMMSAALFVSLVIIIVDISGFHSIERSIQAQLSGINFNFLLMNCMLSFLLFAGAMSINITELKTQKWEVLTLSTFTTIATAFLVSAVLYYILILCDIKLPFVYCMLFGALISPTDPIAVLAIIKKVNAPKNLEVKLAGESLFNDGVGIVLFITTFAVAFTSKPYTHSQIVLLFCQEAIGGIIYGAILGFIASRLIRTLDNRNIIIFITLVITTGAYALANELKISGALAMVVAGIIIGNCKLTCQNGDTLKQEVVKFWEIIDELLNAILFLLIGIELLMVYYDIRILCVSLISILAVLLVRWVTVAIPMAFFKLKKTYFPNTIMILTWGGLRGGLAVALALAIPKGYVHNIIIQLTFSVVIFSILIQGTTIKKLVLASKTEKNAS